MGTRYLTVTIYQDGTYHIKVKDDQFEFDEVVGSDHLLINRLATHAWDYDAHIEFIYK